MVSVRKDKRHMIFKGYRITFFPTPFQLLRGKAPDICMVAFPIGTIYSS